MLSRRHIRVKVMQVLYAFDGTESDDFSKDQKFLLYSIDNMYNLYLMTLSLMIEVGKKSKTQLETIQKKHLATAEEKNPNKKFINNQVLELLSNNVALKTAFEVNNIKNWQLDNEYVDIIYKEIIASDLYKEYMQTKTSTFKEDRNFIVDVFKEIIAPNDKLYDYIEDKNLTWLDDLPTVNTAILKSKLSEEISSKTKNWDTERIANLDMVLLKMAICELTNFPSIPTKVTINEYLEIAKEYSTPKSSIFINGILDKLLKEYEQEGKLNKVGRGLM